MSEIELLVKASGCRIYQKGDLVFVMKQPAQWIPTVRFVLLLISGIPLIYGVISLITYLQGAETGLGMSILFILVGTFFSLVYVAVNKYSKNINSLPPEECETVCTFDLKENNLIDPNGKVLDSLDQVSITRQFQLTSSSKKLVAHYSKGSILLAKGNPFSEGTTLLETVFQELGLMN